MSFRKIFPASDSSFANSNRDNKDSPDVKNIQMVSQKTMVGLINTANFADKEEETLFFKGIEEKSARIKIFVLEGETGFEKATTREKQTKIIKKMFM